MKIFIFIIVSTLIILKGGWGHEECGIKSSYQAVSPVVWSEQTIDGSFQNPVITRFFHNKIGIFVSQITKCYFDRISPEFIFDCVGIFGLIFLFYSIYLLLKNSQVLILVAIFLVTLMPTVSINLPTSIIGVNILAYLYKLLAISGLSIYLFSLRDNHRVRLDG